MLGLGNIGALAGKPVMEGKGYCSRNSPYRRVRYRGDELDPDKFINVVAALEPTFGGINLEDIKAPECFYIEQKLRERMNIPVFHDDQHGTAIYQHRRDSQRPARGREKSLRRAHGGLWRRRRGHRLYEPAGGAGMQKHNIVVCDSKGVIYKDREPNMAETKAAYAVDDDGKRTLDDVIDGADIFLGCSVRKC